MLFFNEFVKLQIFKKIIVGKKERIKKRITKYKFNYRKKKNTDI